MLSLMIFFSIGFGEGDIISVFSQNDKNKAQTQNSNSNNNDDREELATIKVKMNKNNLDIDNHDRIKLVGYLNGEGQIKYIALKELNKGEKEEEKSTTTTNSKNINPLIADLKFNKSNDISSVMVDDEYYLDM